DIEHSVQAGLVDDRAADKVRQRGDEACQWATAELDSPWRRVARPARRRPVGIGKRWSARRARQWSGPLTTSCASTLSLEGRQALSARRLEIRTEPAVRARRDEVEDRLLARFEMRRQLKPIFQQVEQQDRYRAR